MITRLMLLMGALLSANAYGQSLQGLVGKLTGAAATTGTNYLPMREAIVALGVGAVPQLQEEAGRASPTWRIRGIVAS